jgi:Protein of unknown function (DUF1761)
MYLHRLNLLAVLVAAVSTMVVGLIWYSPVLFDRPWVREMEWDPDDVALAVVEDGLVYPDLRRALTASTSSTR